ncbi:spore protease YyaC [Haloimpatiens sp. FM7315]|uniref:spore protease YyaC n=1 Tax=Haloimpatiens sp. FM7315 TaxID=3298609 RepID=UPI0035A384DC
MNNKQVLDSTDINCIFKLRDVLSQKIINALNLNKEIVILCIGTDRSTGDSLGPLVGEKLKFLVRNNLYIYGNLGNPVHAKNLCSVLKTINSELKNPFIIAIDACLGSLHNVGSIIIEEGPLSPGAAMDKDLPLVGNISIKGIVNISGTLEFLVLQNTRLNTVMQIADIISKGLYHSILKTLGGPSIAKKTQNKLVKESKQSKVDSNN